jgi:hypothetical protein
VKRFRFRLLSLMIVVAMTALAVWGYAMRRRSAEFASAIKRRSAEFASKADQHRAKLFELKLNLMAAVSFRGDVLPVVGALDQTPQESERQLRHLEDFYGNGLTERDLARRDLTKSGQARKMLLLLWIRYEVYMYFKYRRAATRPWLPVDPDPPVPPLGPYISEGDESWSDRELQARIAEYWKTLPLRVPE